jgi:hypothetical protein
LIAAIGATPFLSRTTYAVYGGCIPGSSTDKLVTVPAKSLFGEVCPGRVHRCGEEERSDVHDHDDRPLPTADRTGAVVGLLLLPTLIGGYLIASMLFSATQTAAVAGRIAIVLAFSIVVALVTAVGVVAAAAAIAITVPTLPRWLPGLLYLLVHGCPPSSERMTALLAAGSPRCIALALA